MGAEMGAELPLQAIPCVNRIRGRTRKPLQSLDLLNGAKRIRTADPLHAMQVLYQLSYGPFIRQHTCRRAAQTWRQTATSRPCTDT